jgi:hypothetical protein
MGYRIKITNWWTVRKLRLGLRLYSDSQRQLNATRDESGQLPEALHHYVRDLLKQRQAWSLRIDELKAAGVLSEDKATELKKSLG